MANRLIQGTAIGLMAATSILAHATSPSPGELHYSSGAARLGAPSAWTNGATGQGIIIAVIDTGVNAAHNDLSGHVLRGYNAVNRNRNTRDGNGHGTHVAGILGALANNSGIVGVAYDAKIRPVKVFDASGSGNSATLGAGIRYAIRSNSKILNMSLAASGPIVENELRLAVTNNRLTVAAAGNSGRANPEWPARYASQRWARGRIIAVGAVDENNVIASFSNRAGVSRNFFLVAPGTSILSTYKNGYAYLSGTSMATPYVSGAAAVVWSYWPYMNATQVARTLFKTATDLGKPGIDAIYGRGLVNLERALQPVGATSISTSSTTSSPSSSTGSTTTTASVSTWIGGASYATRLYNFAQQGGLKAAVTDELGRDFQTDLGALVSEPNSMTLEGMFSQMDQQQRLTEQVLANGTRLTLAPSSLASNPNYAFTDEDSTLLPGSFALTTQLANGDAWGVGVNNFGNRFFGLGAAHFDNSPAFDSPALSNPLYAYVPQHSHLGYAFNLDHGMQLRVGMLSDGLNSLYSSNGNGPSVGSSNLWTTELSHQTVNRYLAASITQLHEQDSLLGSQQDALFGLNNTAVTTDLSVQAAWRLAPGLALAGRYSVGYTAATKASGDSLITQLSDVRTESFAVSLAQADSLRKGDRLSLSVSQPLRASSGTLDFELPVGFDINGQMHYESRTANLASSGRELRTELNYTTPLARNQDIGVTLAHRIQPDHDAQAPADNLIALRWGLRF